MSLVYTLLRGADAEQAVELGGSGPPCSSIASCCSPAPQAAPLQKADMSGHLQAAGGALWNLQAPRHADNRAATHLGCKQCSLPTSNISSPSWASD